MQTAERPKRMIDQAWELQALQMIDIPEEATPEEVSQIEAEWVAKLESQHAHMGERLLKLRAAIEYQKAIAKMHKDDADMRAKAAKAHAKEAERMEAYMFACLIPLGGKLEADGYVFGIKKNPVSVVVVPETVLPAEYTRVTVDPDKKRIKEALQSGREIPGCSLTQLETLSIKAV